MIKRYGRRTIKILSLLLAAFLVLALLQEYVFRDSWQHGQISMRYKGFYREPEDTLDVVLIGDSTFYAGYSAPYAYEREGFTSYHLSFASNVCVTWRPLTEEILSRQNPQWIVIEMGPVTYPDLQKQFDESFTIHFVIDNMPMNANRIRTIQREVVGRYHGDALEYYLPFIRYHNDWSTLGGLANRAREMFAWKYRSRNALKGTVARVKGGPAPKDLVDARQDNGTEPISAESEAVLREYLAYCREEGINVLFVATPLRLREGGVNQQIYRKENYAGQIVREYGFDFVNFNQYIDEIGLDVNADFYNDAHLNYHGQIKYTAFLARFLVENYGVRPGTLSDSQRAEWDRSADYVRRFYAYLDTLPADYNELCMENIETMQILDAMGS